MTLELYQRVSLRRDIPEKNLKRGVVGTLIDYIPHPRGGEIGCVLEVFNVLGESVEVVVVPRSDIKELQENEFFSVQKNSKDLLADIISFTINHPAAMNGSVPVDDGILLFPSARDIMMAGACSEINPKTSFPNRKPELAVEYVKHLQLAQTSYGSYVVNVISPLSVESNSTRLRNFSFNDQEPFERRAVKRLAQALESLRVAAEQTNSPENLHSFYNTVQEGVSSNLCRAILKMNEGGGRAGIKVSFSWSSEILGTDNFPKEIVFPPKAMPMIEAFADKLETYTALDVEVRGKIIRLQRSEEDSKGQIVIKGLVKDLEVKRAVKVELSEEEYALATQAHNEKKVVTCRGDLLKEGRSFELQNPRYFAVLNTK
jgi:hypothetical protein